MTYAEFVALVAGMREAQRSYFRERTPQALEDSKYMEHKVDKAVKAIQDPQAKLF